MLRWLMIATGFKKDDIRRKNCEELKKREDTFAAIANTFNQLHKPRVSGCCAAVNRSPRDREQTWLSLVIMEVKLLSYGQTNRYMSILGKKFVLSRKDKSGF